MSETEKGLCVFCKGTRHLYDCEAYRRALAKHNYATAIINRQQPQPEPQRAEMV